jgi:hypothetical protein
MKVVQWNISKKIYPMYGFKRYKDEISRNIKGIGREDD